MRASWGFRSIRLVGAGRIEVDLEAAWLVRRVAASV
jgi:hypothetical protein